MTLQHCHPSNIVNMVNPHHTPYMACIITVPSQQSTPHRQSHSLFLQPQHNMQLQECYRRPSAQLDSSHPEKKSRRLHSRKQSTVIRQHMQVDSSAVVISDSQRRCLRAHGTDASAGRLWKDKKHCSAGSLPAQSCWSTPQYWYTLSHGGMPRAAESTPTAAVDRTA